jgi:glycosyltransferase involved in cell wall biosynthesis
MKLLHLIPTLTAAGAGPTEGLKNLAAATVRLGHDVAVATLDAPATDLPRNLGFAVHTLGPGFRSYGYTPHLLPWLRQHVREFDALIVEGIWQYHSLAAWRAARAAGVPYFVFSHGMLSPWFKHHYPLKHLKKMLYWPFEYRVLRDAQAVLFTSGEEARLARQSFRPYRIREQLVGYGTRAPTGDADALRQAFRDRHPELRDRRLLLYLGRLHPVKGCDQLIEAFAGFTAGHPDIHLIIAGPDQDGWQRELEAQAGRLGISDRITWTGSLAPELKWGALHAADALILPSHQENFGVVIAEALACGKPVLISDKVNIWQEVLADGAGFVADDSVAGASVNLAAWLRLSRDEYAAMGLRARACFDTRFEISRTAQRLLEVVGGAVQQRAART